MYWIESTKKAIKVILFNVALIIFLLMLYELFIFFLVQHPGILKKCPMFIRNSIGHLYNSGIRHNIQFSPTCAQFDKNLGYILKSGHCTHSGIEFSNSYLINSVGVRDDELSLDHPEIIVSGDSFAMGWGVNQEESFAQLLEQKSGMMVLNASVSSYGTAREMIMLKRVKTDKLKYLIIQYCGNDYEENKSFFLNHNVLHTMSKEKYQYYVAEDQMKKYVFGKYVFMEIENRIKETFYSKNSNDDENKPIDKDEIDLFLNAIINSNLDLKNVQIIAFVMNGRIAEDNKEFPAMLKKKITSRDYPDYIRRMIVVDFSNILNDDNFYVLDDHLNKTGHAVVADVLYKTISK